MTQKEKQPASESLQKWILFLSGLIFSALAYQNVQMTSALIEMQRLNDAVERNGRHIEESQNDIRELQEWRHSQPFREPYTPAVPKNMIMPDRRLLHLPVKPPMRF